MNTLRIFLFLTAISVAAESASSQSAESAESKAQQAQSGATDPKNNPDAAPKLPINHYPLMILSELKVYIILGILLSLIAITLQIWFKLTKRQKSKSSDYSNGQVPSRMSTGLDSDITALKNGLNEILKKLNQQADAVLHARKLESQCQEHIKSSEGYRGQVEERDKSINDLKTEIEKLKSSISVLQVANNRIPSLEQTITNAEVEIKTARAAQEKERSEFKARLASFFPESADAELSLSIDELKAATVRSDANARAALSCLVFIRAAESGQVEEEALLSVLRQFSESLAAYLKSTGCNPLQVVGVLAQWADDLGTRFSTRTKIRVPSIGYPIEVTVMSTDSSASKVSEVASWCVYNSKGGIYAAARVS
jgi:hypothetical protein